MHRAGLWGWPQKKERGLGLLLEVLAGTSTGALQISLNSVNPRIASQSGLFGNFDLCALPQRTFPRGIPDFQANVRLGLYTVVLRDREIRKTFYTQEKNHSTRMAGVPCLHPWRPGTWLFQEDRGRVRNEWMWTGRCQVLSQAVPKIYSVCATEGLTPAVETLLKFTPYLKWIFLRC